MSADDGTPISRSLTALREHGQLAFFRDLGQINLWVKPLLNRGANGGSLQTTYFPLQIALNIL